MPTTTNPTSGSAAKAARQALLRKAGAPRTDMIQVTPDVAAAATPTPKAETAIGRCVTAFTDAFDAMLPSWQAVADAAEATEKAGKAEGNQREVLLAKLAKLAIAGKFTADQVASARKEAVEAWLKGRNFTPKSLGQFALECEKAMHPKAREHVEDALRISRKAWNAERKAVAEAKAEGDDLPEETLKRAFTRPYAMATGMIGALVPDAKGVVKYDHTVAMDPHALAEARSVQQAVNANRAARIVAKAAEDLAGILASFPDEFLAEAIDALAEVSKDTLEGAARAKAAKAKRDAKQAKRGVRPVAPKAAKGVKAALPEVDDDLDDEIDELLDDE